jgi:protein involved in plasmid replication-relaxation
MKTATRPRVTDDLVMDAASRLTDRDHDILRMVHQHRVLTTEHICDLFFDNETTARHRLTKLYQLRLVDRFQPMTPRHGSEPLHYVLGHVGAMVVAAEDGRELAKVRWREDKAIFIGRSSPSARRAARPVLEKLWPMPQSR